MNSSSQSPSCNLPFSGVSLPEWRPNFLTSELSVALISITIVNLLVSPLTIFLNVLVMLAVKTTPPLRNTYNALLACLAGTDIMAGALGQPLFIAELIYRLTGSPSKEVLTPVTQLEMVCFAHRRGQGNGRDLKQSGGGQQRKTLNLYTSPGTKSDRWHKIVYAGE